jgi:pSer/pThr/pTyr-binding forkhead associated (FHA) protein
VADRDGQVHPAVTLTRRGVSVGRQRDNDVMLLDKQVSRHHLRIDWDGQQATVTDLGTGNGTWLNGTRLPERLPQPWTPGTDLTVGPFWLRLDVSGAAGRGGFTPGTRGSDLDQDFPPIGAGVQLGSGGSAVATQLVVVDQDGQEQQSFELREGAIAVGRGPDNDVVLADQRVSRHHLRVDWDGRQVTLTDLASDNGTFLGDLRLPVNSPQAWPAPEWVRIGPFWLRLQLPAVAGQADPASGQVTALGRIQLLLDDHALTLTPGQPATVSGTLANLGTTVDHFYVSVDGVPMSWITGDVLRRGDDKEVQLNPGASRRFTLTVTAPRVSESRAGEYPVTILAHSLENPDELGVSQGTWTVLPFTASCLAVVRAWTRGRRRGRFGVIVRNQGNAPNRYALAATDEERKLRYRFEPDTVAVEPGKAANAGLTVQAPWYWAGQPQARPFAVTASPADGDPPPGATAELVQLALVPPWLPRAVAAIIPLLLIVIIVFQQAISALLRPNISQFTFDGHPTPAIQGQPVTVRWQVERAQRVQIEGLDTTATPNPQRGEFRIEQGLGTSQELKLVASNLFGLAEQTRVIPVLTWTPTATPTPTPTPTPTSTPEPTATAEIPIPVVEVFVVEPLTVVAGDQVTITWQVRDAQFVVIEGLSAAQLQPSGQLTHRPERTTTYILTSSNQGRPGQARSLEVVVRTPTPPPSPTPPPTPPPPTPPPG